MTNASADSNLAEILESARKLEPSQLNDLVELLEAMLADDPGYYPDWHRQAVREAIARMDANPDSGIPAEESLRNVRQALDKLRSDKP
ncbi:MAG: hypothetical protein H6841_10490 [Planctomycetes bacterium]|nr:hypothetical protein [Planctomycetota bacterium]MCB9936525.1 hypothetical protein [Planctomycetota bacterium]